MKFFVYTALFSVLFSLSSRLLVCVDYLIRKDYYAEVLCENKEEPESCCEGKCAMGKELVNLEEKEQDQPANTKAPVVKLNKVDEALCLSFKLKTILPLTAIVETKQLFRLQNGFPNSSYRPPDIYL